MNSAANSLTALPSALAFDTSAYTTSVALVAQSGEILADKRRILPVPEGQRGLRQSEAFFHHIRHLPELLEELAPLFQTNPPHVVAASNAPRNLPDSYMPVFRAGSSWARSVAALLGIPYLEWSHQEGHLWAAFLDQSETIRPQQPFLAVHISGGTTEAIVGSLQDDGRIASRIAGSTGDLTAGKFVDRLGVAIGLPFPAGAALESLAATAAMDELPQVPVAVNRTQVSFSGPLTALERMRDRFSPATIAATAQRCLAESLVRWLSNVVEQENADLADRRVFIVGGVAANQEVRQAITAGLQAFGFHAVFASPAFSTDNALGIAWAAVQTLLD